MFSKNALSVEVFFTFIALIITFIYLNVFIKIYSKCFEDRRVRTNVLLIFFSLVLFSSWYLVSTTNGLRQGISLVFLYWGCVEYVYERRKLKFLLLLAISTSFHYSCLLVIPFLLIYYLQFRYVFLLWAGAAVGYMTGINELVVKEISQALHLPVYEFIKYYSLEKGATEGGLYNGFILAFFVYTLFWPIIILFLLKIKFRFKSKIANYSNIYKLIKIYFIFSIVYFILGFGPFSNRYAFFSWFIVPYMQIVILSLTFNLNSNRIVPLLALFSSIVFFLYFKLEWISFFYG